MAHFIPSNKKKKDGSDSFLLVDADEYIYRFKYANKKEKIWKCVKLEERNCKAEVRTNLTVSKFFLKNASKYVPVIWYILFS